MTNTATRSVPFARPWITDADREAVMEVLNGPILAHGPHSNSFEAEFAAFLGTGAHAVTVSSCMAALHLAYLQFGIGPGDDVIVPAQTHVATAHAVEAVGATPVFVDCDPATGNVTVERIAAALTPRTKAISVVHFVGIPCAMPDIVDLAKRHSLKVIEDCALAVGTRYEGTHVGLFGDAGCFSFYPVKHLTTGEGGMFVTRHEPVAAAVRGRRAFGVDRTHSQRAVPGMYDVPAVGLNYRMSEMQAALGRSQLRRIDENLAKRNTNFATLKSALASTACGRILDVADSRATSSHYCLSLVVEQATSEIRQTLIARLNEAGIGTSVYYPQPVPRMTYYARKYGYDERLYPSAVAISDRSVALSVGPHIGLEEMSTMVDRIPDVLSGMNI